MCTSLVVVAGVMAFVALTFMVALAASFILALLLAPVLAPFYWLWDVVSEWWTSEVSIWDAWILLMIFVVFISFCLIAASVAKKRRSKRATMVDVVS